MGVGRGEASTRCASRREGVVPLSFSFGIFGERVCACVRAFDELMRFRNTMMFRLRSKDCSCYACFSLSLSVYRFDLFRLFQIQLFGWKCVFARHDGASESKVVFWQAVRTEWGGESRSEGFVLEGFFSSFLFF